MCFLPSLLLIFLLTKQTKHDTNPTPAAAAAFSTAVSDTATCGRRLGNVDAVTALVRLAHWQYVGDGHGAPGAG